MIKRKRPKKKSDLRTTFAKEVRKLTRNASKRSNATSTGKIN